MATRIVEGKKPYTGGKAITVDENKVISLNLRDENNLIIYDEGDDEIYVDLQLEDGIEPTDAFPVGVNTGRVLLADGWDKTGTLISAKTTSGDYIRVLYADDGTLWIDNGTGTFKQIYFKGDIDDLLSNKQNLLIPGTGIDITNDEISNTAPFEPTNEGQGGQVLTRIGDGYGWANPTGGSSTITVTLAAANWSSQSITVSATGVTASNTVIVSPDPSDFSDYTDAGIYCSAQGTNSLTFDCDTTPSNDIDVNVVILS